MKALCHSVVALLGLVLPAAAATNHPAERDTTRYIEWRYYLENTRNVLATDLEVWVYAPVLDGAKQGAVTVKTTPDARITKDALGNQLVHFAITNLAPLATRVVRVEAEVTLLGAPPAAPVRSEKRFLEPEPFIESDAAPIRDLSASFRNPSASVTARAIYNWMLLNIRNAGFDTDEHGALWGLQNGRGDCTEMAELFVALCRAAGVPARLLGGFVCPGNCIAAPDAYHNWAEFYDGSRWQTVDVQLHKFAGKADSYVATTIFAPSTSGQLPGRFHQALVKGEGIRMRAE